jgi:hypothetical protein
VLRVSLLLGLVYLISELLLTFSTSSRHGGQAKAGSAAPLATVFCKWSVATRQRLPLFAGDTPASTANHSTRQIMSDKAHESVYGARSNAHRE